MTAKVSVIITSYNYARFIGEAIQSVLDQTYRDLEIIVVDDGSTDHTRAVLDGFGGAITCMYQENMGKSSALNRGIAAATGEYLAFLDSDDCWLPDAVERRLAIFEQHPDVGVVYGRTLMIDAAGTLLPYCNGGPLRYPDDTVRSLLHAVHIPFLTFMVRRESLQRAGGFFDLAYGASNDWELFLRLGFVCRFFYINEPLAQYRVHDANWSRNTAAVYAEMTRLVHTAVSAQDVPPSVRCSRPTILRNLYTTIGLGFLDTGAYHRSLQYFAHAVAVSRHPSWAVVRIVYLIISSYARRDPCGAALVEGMGRYKQRLNDAVGSWSPQT